MRQLAPHVAAATAAPSRTPEHCHLDLAGVVANLLLAAPQLAGSAQRGVMRVLHSLASVPNAVSTCFPRQQAVHSMMQVLDGTPSSPTVTGPAADGAAQRSVVSGGSNSGAVSGLDAAVSSRALEVLLAVCRADETALKEIKDFPGRCSLHPPGPICTRIPCVLPVALQLSSHHALSAHYSGTKQPAHAPSQLDLTACCDASHSPGLCCC